MSNVSNSRLAAVRQYIEPHPRILIPYRREVYGGSIPMDWNCTEGSIHVERQYVGLFSYHYTRTVFLVSSTCVWLKIYKNIEVKGSFMEIMPISLFWYNIQLQCQSIVSLCILDIFFAVRYYRTVVISMLLWKRLQYQEHPRGKVNPSESGGRGR